MRFIKTGPDIPGELLFALDEDRVVFFCGAGVSRAKAELPDFFGLADEVLRTLGVNKSDPAAKFLAKTRDIEKRMGVPGLISVDRVFGLLEREFSSVNIDCAVAKALRPKANAELSAHNLLLDLATSQDGTTKLVTTNFDRLFDDCGRGLKAWQPPRLPDPTQPGEINGVVYLHGRATEKYDGSEGDSFVLSSAEFGRAYLAEGWATQFFKGVIDRYAVVFVGYTADDPPVQYLLEALNKTNGRLREVYAFQSGEDGEAKARWEHKGVTAIPYSEANRHEALWTTLERWADRAKDPDGWRNSTIELARRGPEALTGFERERVAHLVSYKEGARKFLEYDPPLPATWLCVFDRSIRYSVPVAILSGENEGKTVDPFPLYGLTSDLVPPPIHPDDLAPKRETPSMAWDAFLLNRRDRTDLRDDHVAALCGDASLCVGCLPDRINLLASWIAKVATQSAAVWWAARKNSLHPRLQQVIRNSLGCTVGECEPHILQAWHYLFEHWQNSADEDQFYWYQFAEELKVVGWNKVTVRKYETLSRPRLTVSHNYYRPAVPPKVGEETKLGDLVSLELRYIKNRPEIKVPDVWVADVVSALKRNLDIGIQLETERGLYGFLHIPPIFRPDDPTINDYEPNECLRGAVLDYAAMFERLIAVSPETAQQEASTWSIDDDNIFARLRIWASAFEIVVSNNDFLSFTNKVSRNAFWNDDHQRDLLLMLKIRWATLPPATTRKIEDRIITGRERCDNESEHEFVGRRAWQIADRLHWLHTNGCTLNLNFDDEVQRLRLAAPDWTPEYGAKAAESLESRGGLVRIHTEFDELFSEPLDRVLIRSQELSGWQGSGLDKRDPFAGLCRKLPVVAISALRRAAMTGEYPEEWRRFLYSEGRKNDNPRLRRFIAELLLQLSAAALADIMYPVSEWLLVASKKLTEDCVRTFDRLLDRLFESLRSNPDGGGSGIVRGNNDPDWANEALSSPAGKIAQALFNDPRRKDIKHNQGLPIGWRAHVELALALPSDNNCHSLVIFSYFLHWFYNVDPKWTKVNLLSRLEYGSKNELDAWWDGYLLGVRNRPSYDLFQKFKPHVLKRVTERGYEDREKQDRLVSFVMANWVHSDFTSGEVRISDTELRDLLLAAGDSFRTQALWEMERRGQIENEDGQLWSSLQNHFLRNVWPMQRSACTPQTSARLIEFAFSNKDRFEEISELIIPLIGSIGRVHTFLQSLRRSEDNIVDTYPERVLEILYMALPEDANEWPYEIDARLRRVAEVSLKLRTDTRWVELMRRWNSR